MSSYSSAYLVRVVVLALLAATATLGGVWVFDGSQTSQAGPLASATRADMAAGTAGESGTPVSTASARATRAAAETGVVPDPTASSAVESRTASAELDAASSESLDDAAASSAAAGAIEARSNTSGADRAAAPVPTVSTVAVIPRDLSIRSQPGGGTRIGTLPARSRYLGSATWAWIQQTSSDGRYGLVTVPWSRSRRAGWVDLDGIETYTTGAFVRISLRERRLRAWDGGKLVVDAPTAIGASASPTPPGRYWVTDRSEVPRSQPYFGGYAFGMSGIQTRLPAGWRGKDQLAIHGTNSPSTIGTPSSAGCLRVSESTLRKLKPLLLLGSPVVVES